MSHASKQDPRELLRAWITPFAGPECALLAASLPVGDRDGMLRVLRPLMDCVIRRILPLPDNAYSALRDLPSLVDPDTRTKAEAILRAQAPRSPSPLGSALMAMFHLERLATAPSHEEAVTAWTSVFYPSGPLEMAVRRIISAGASRSAVAAALRETFEELAR